MSNQNTKAAKKNTNPIDTHALEALQEEMAFITHDLATSTLASHKEISDRLIEQMKEPTWQMECFCLLQGKVQGLNLLEEVKLRFNLDIRSLFDHSSALTDSYAKIRQIAETIGGEELGDEMADIVTDSILPHSVGELQDVEIHKLQVVHPNSKEYIVAIKKEGYVIMEATQEAVLFDFADALSPHLKDGRVIFHLDATQFKESVFIAKALLQTQRKITEDFQWQDTSPGNDVNISISLNCHRL